VSHNDRRSAPHWQEKAKKVKQAKAARTGSQKKSEQIRGEII